MKTVANFPDSVDVDVDELANTVPVLLKAIRVLEEVAQNPRNATNKSLALTLNVSPTTCFRILKSFVAMGWLRPGAGGTFELSSGLAPVFRPLLRQELLIDAVREPLATLANATHLTAKVAVRQGFTAVTIHSVVPPGGSAVKSRTGLATPLTVGSSGAVFLSACDEDEVCRALRIAPASAWRFQNRADVLQRMREAISEGVCFDHGSYAGNIHTLSAPFYDRRHRIAGVITLLGTPQDFEPLARRVLVRELKHAADSCHLNLTGQIPASAA